MPKKKIIRFTDIEKGKIYKLYTEHTIPKKELATTYNCSLSIIKNLIENYNSPLLHLRLHAKKNGIVEPVSYANEKWKQLIYPTRTKYEVSTLGRVRSYYPNPEIPVINRGILQAGFLFLDYYNTEQKRRIKLPFHIIAADHFLIKKTPEQNRVLHLDYKKANNRISNLRWGTDEQLYAHNNKNPAIKLARDKANAGRTLGAKLSLIQVERIRKLINDPNRKITKQRIAAMYGITPMTLYRIQSGQIWGTKGNHQPYQKKIVVRLDSNILQAIKKKLSKEDAVQSGIAKEFGVSTSVINRIKQGKTYKD